MRLGLCLLAISIACAQAPDPAAQAYDALRAGRYDDAVALFLHALDGSPGRASLHQDLAYTYLKIGEREEARDHFAAAMRLDPAAGHAALEYAFLCYETHEEAEARRVFDRLRQSRDAETRQAAEQAFRNIDEPLAAGIARWQQALARGDRSFSTHYALAQLAEQRDQPALAAEHYEKAWRLAPERRGVLIDLGLTWKALGRTEDAAAALLAASRAGEARAAERARALLPTRYPYVYEFQNALRLDPGNAGLRREFAFLLLRMDREAEAEEQLRAVLRQSPDDLLAAAQLGFLLLAHGNDSAALPLLERVLKGGDEELANRVRAVLRLPQLERRGRAAAGQADAKEMAERSIKAGYLRDAVRYLLIAQETDPLDFQVMLRLGWMYNILHDDPQAARWFNLARKSPDPELSAQASRAWRNLRSELERFPVTAWSLPVYSTRWRDLFSYSQVKVEWNTGTFVRPYVSLRAIMDARSRGGYVFPLYYSESAAIVALGLATRSRHGIVLWGEAGENLCYLSGHALPDYRGGLSLARAWNRRHWFFDTVDDALFVSRFQNDTLLYARQRAGYGLGPRALRVQLYCNGNFTIDSKRQYWANFVETGPGVRLHPRVLGLPVVSVDLVRGAYTLASHGRQPNFWDLRVSFWYAVSR